jgi:hypothetical protein
LAANIPTGQDGKGWWSGAGSNCRPSGGVQIPV